MARRFTALAALALAGCAADPAQRSEAAAHEFAPAPTPMCLRGSYTPRTPNLVEMVGAALARADTSSDRLRNVESEARRKSYGCSIC